MNLNSNDGNLYVSDNNTWVERYKCRETDNKQRPSEAGWTLGVGRFYFDGSYKLGRMSIRFVDPSVSGMEIAEELDGVAAEKVGLSVRDNQLGITLATGYCYSLSFLPQYIDTSRCTNGTVPIQGTKAQSTRSQQIYYTEEPTIGFIDMNTGIETYSEFTSVALSKVSSGQARLSSSDSMREMHEEHVGKGVQLSKDDHRTSEIQKECQPDACKRRGRSITSYLAIPLSHGKGPAPATASHCKRTDDLPSGENVPVFLLGPRLIVPHTAPEQSWIYFGDFPCDIGLGFRMERDENGKHVVKDTYRVSYDTIKPVGTVHFPSVPDIMDTFHHIDDVPSILEEKRIALTNRNFIAFFLQMLKEKEFYTATYKLTLD
ncbi:hypothetical protein C8J55DRAFT_553020 [Lentinula edodes]|uniref:Uncharacterized protein n=1 Tax=Lentinula lateritia TaxID=40482 RepID=A0A9W8ZQT6_9AGAR|nr:hypothetical protein C8J55DRAFT_553020 [Lentinula edodes]